MKLIIVTPYFSRPDFIQVQYQQYQKFLQGSWEWIILNDANDPVTRQQIADHAAKLVNVKCVDVPTDLHDNLHQNPSDCAATIVQYSLQEYLHPEKKDEILCLIDADMFLIQPLHLIQYMQEKDLYLVGRKQEREHIQYISNGLLFFASAHWTREMVADFDFRPGFINHIRTDTGGFTYHFFTKYPWILTSQKSELYSDVCLRDIKKSEDSSSSLDTLREKAKQDPFPMELHFHGFFLHYRAGSNWIQESETYHQKKTQALLTFLRPPVVEKKNLISFCLYNQRPKDVLNAVFNCMLSPHVYPGWLCRFYVDDTIPDFVKQLLQSFKHVEMVQMPRHKGSEAMLWRFYPAVEENVNFMICRDADSWLSTREAVCVQEWLQSGKSTHIIRDHCYHSQKMMAGMWGCDVGKFRALCPDFLQDMKMFLETESHDQTFLARHVYPLVQNDLLVHYGNPQYDNQGQVVNGYFHDNCVPIPDYKEIDEYVCDLSFLEIQKRNEMHCSHCKQTHRTFIGAILEKIPERALQVLTEYAKSQQIPISQLDTWILE